MSEEIKEQAVTKTTNIVAKPLINHRWNLPSLGGMLDQMLPEWSQGNHPDFSGPDGYAKMRGAFEQFGDSLLYKLQITLEKAAGRGIDEALKLIRDPEYHKTVKRRTKRAIERDKENREQQDRWRERWERCEFTQDERLYEVGRLTRDLKYHQDQIDKLNERKKRVESGTVLLEEAEAQPEAFRARVIRSDDGDEWPDQISFD